jgi:signal peptidase II
MLKKMKNSGLCWLWVTVIVLILDRVTKYLVQTYLTAYQAVPIFPFFNLTLAYNKGAAFSFLDKSSGWQGWMFGGISILASVVILVWMSRLTSKQRWVSGSLAFILGGALGNLSDRFLYGHVIDFLDFHLKTLHWPVFNVADSAICVGAVMLLLDAIFHEKSKK